MEPAPKKKATRPKLNPELVAAALVELSGNVSAVARKFGVHRSSVQEMIKKRPALSKIAEDCRESMLDDAETSLYKSVRAGESWAVCFFLKTQGKARGYIERAPAIRETTHTPLVVGGEADPANL